MPTPDDPITLFLVVLFLVVLLIAKIIEKRQK